MVQHSHKVGDVWYRYEVSTLNPDHVFIYLRRIPVMRVTDKCVFVYDDHISEDKRIGIDHKKKFAYPTIVEAQDSIRIRRNYYLEHCKHRLDDAQRAVNAIAKLDATSWDMANGSAFVADIDPL